MSGIAIFNKAVSTLQDSQKNLMAIKAAREKLDQDKEMFGLRKKKAELDIEMAQKEGRMTDIQADTLRAQTDAYLKQESDKHKGNVASIKLAEQENASVAEKAMHWAKVGFKSDPQGVMGFLQARDRNAARTQEIVPKMSYGNVGFETRDIEEKKSPKAVRGNPDKDVASLAVRLSSDGGGDPEDYMDKARRMLGGGVNSKSALKQTAPEFDPEIEEKITDTMKKYGKTREEVVATARKKGLIK